MEAHHLAPSYHIIRGAQRMNGNPVIFMIRSEKFFIFNGAGSRYNAPAANILPFNPENTPFHNAGLRIHSP